jgi:hypothetical protein
MLQAISAAVTGKLARRVFGLALAIVAASLVCTLAWALFTIAKRPLDGVEGDVLFEADRIRAGLPLYVDPLVGAREYGPPPSRYFVLYPPLWSAALALVPRGLAIVSGRLVALLAWFGAIALVAIRANEARRRQVVIAGAFVGGIWVLGLYGASARPDAAAVFFSTVGLERVARRSAAGKRIAFDVLAALAFTLAAWIKPNVVGAAPGMVLGCLVATRGSLADKLKAVLPAIATIALASGAIAAVLHVASHGVWLTHLLASTGQRPDASLWLEQIGSRGPFFLLPLLAVLALGLRARHDPGALVATSALVTSLVWALASLAKTGSASNYFLEPCIAMLVVLSHVDFPALRGRAEVAFAALALGQVGWNGAASIGAASRELRRASDRASVLENARAACGTGVILADEPGLELTLNGRLVMTPFQTTHRVRRGAFPAEVWVADVESPAVTCLVMQDDLLERPLDDERPAHDRFTPAMRRVLGARFELRAKSSGLFVYRARAPKEAP